MVTINLDWQKSLNYKHLGLFIVLFAVLLIPLVKVNNMLYGVVSLKLILLYTLSSMLVLLLTFDGLNKKSDTTFIGILISVFILEMFLNVFFSKSLFTSIFGNYGRFLGFLFYLFSILFFYVGRWLEDYKSPIFLTLILSGTIVALIGIFQFWHGSARVDSTFGNPLLVANFLLLVIPILIGNLYNTSEGKFVLPGLFGLFVMFVAVVFTFSRAAWIGLLLIFVFFIISTGKHILKFRKLNVMIAMTLLLAITTSILMIYFQPGQTLIKSNRLEVMDNIDIPRLLLWKTSWEQFLDNPFGSGISSFAFTSVKYFPKEIINIHNRVEIFWGEAHNEFFQTLSTQGVLGALIFLSIIGVLFLKWFEWKKNGKIDFKVTGLWTAIFIHLFVIMFSFPGVGYTFIFWLYIGLLEKEVFKAIQLKHYKLIPVMKVIFSTGLVLFSIGYSILFYKADTAFFQWNCHSKAPFDTQRRYLDRAVRFAPWEDEYRYSRVYMTQWFLRSNLKMGQNENVVFSLIEDSKILLRDNPLSFRNYELAAETLLILGDNKNALKSYHDALGLYPNNYKYLARVGDILVSLRRNEEAKNYYQKALAIQPAYQPALVGMRHINHQ